MNPVLIFIRKHWPALAAGLVLIALVAWAYLFGVGVGTDRTAAHYKDVLAERDRVAAQELAQAIEEHQAQASAAMATERLHLEAQAKTNQQFKTITRTVTEYIHANPDLDSCGLDPVGLRYWNAANHGGAIDPAGNP